MLDIRQELRQNLRRRGLCFWGIQGNQSKATEKTPGSSVSGAARPRLRMALAFFRAR